jgi:hypothetical protein
VNYRAQERERAGSTMQASAAHRSASMRSGRLLAPTSTC